MDNIKTKKLERWHQIAQAVASGSPDMETKVGAILINKNGAHVMSGFNGFIKKAKDDLLPKTRPEKYPYMVHAEMNLICQCAQHAVSTDQCIVYCTLSPCINCSRMLWQSGIKEVYFKEKYRDFDKNYDMLDLNLKLSERSDGFYHMLLEPK